MILKKIIKNSKNAIFKMQQRINKKKHNGFTEEIDKIALSSSNDRKMESIDLTETYAYRTRKDLVNKKRD